ncbi:glycosyltransferase family 4 protein [Desulfovermiculus halophilus]|uniref:glycosyltransferase family 4 protein n=1 Tax=Desulfovermiculus halophilus TaxID=339722 RepID=UPI0024466633|nr:glycosyltransferase family 4 protein [Desulfovermiculus halophilus]
MSTSRPPRGAGGTRSYEMARRLIANGHEVTMVCGVGDRGESELDGPFRAGRREGMIDGIQVIELALPYSNRDSFLRRTLTFLRFALRSIGIALRRDYDLVFATTTPLTAGIPGIFARWLRRKPFVFEVRDLWPELPRAMGVITNPVILTMMSFLEWSSYRSADRLIGLSPGIVKGIQKRGVDAQRITMIPNGCDIDLFQAEGSPWRPEGVAGNDLMAVFAGAHGIANGLHAVLDAAKELKKRQRQDIKIVLIGDGMQKPALEDRARLEGLSNVVFHGLVKKSDLAGLFQETDIGMQILANVPAFYYGTSPNKFFDYLANGLPVLNNYPGWVADLIQEYSCGFAVPPEDPAAFADALEYAADNRDELVRMGENSKRLALERFHRDILGRQFVEWLEGAVG